MLLAVGAIFIVTWLYAIRDVNPYGDWTHLLLAAGIVALLLHIVRTRQPVPLKPVEPTVGEQRRSSPLLEPVYPADSQDRSRDE